jgi:ABC-2 type transport system permease protein
VTRLLGAEVLKLRTTRTFYGVTLGALVLVVIIVAAAAAAGDHEGNPNAGRELLSIGSLAQAFALVLGILAVTTEFRHGTITPTLLVSPDRTGLVVAKLISHVLAGLALGIVAYGLTGLLALGILSLRDVDSGLEGGDVVRVLAGGIIGTGLYAALGVGVGALVRNQVGAIVGSLAWLFVIEPLLTIVPGIDEAVEKFAPGGAGNGLSQASGDPTAALLGQVPAGLVLTGYVVAFLVGGAILLRRRDVSA